MPKHASESGTTGRKFFAISSEVRSKFGIGIDSWLVALMNV